MPQLPRHTIQHLVALLFLGLAFTSGLQAQEYILDNPKAQKKGSWTETVTSPDKYGDNYHFSSTSADGARMATATYAFPDLAAGIYDVDIFYPQGYKRAINAPWVVCGLNGTFTNYINQQINGGKWMRLVSGVEMNNNANKCYVFLHNNTGAEGFLVVADAVRLTPSKGGAAPAVPIASAPAPISAPQKAEPITPPGGIHKVVVEVSGAGSVTRDPDYTAYPPGSRLALTATAAAGNVFAGWEGSLKSYFNPCVITVKSNMTVKASFLSPGIGVIMDNTQAEYEGVWDVSQTAWPGTRYDDYRYNGAVKGAGSATATYRPNLPRAGKYNVYLWYAAGETRTKFSHWEIAGKDATTTVVVDQKVNGGQWFEIASAVRFDKGTAGYVRLRDGVGNNEPENKAVVVIADGVAFVYVGE